MAKLKSAHDMVKMRAAGQLAAFVLQEAGKHVYPGQTTEQINTVVHDLTVKHGAYPSPLNYHGFPKSVCTSVNEVICHGIPSETHVLQEGDIINIDVTVTLDGYFGDTSKTFYVGTHIPADRRLVTEVAAESLARAIAVVRHGARLGDIGHAIQSYAEPLRCSVVRDFVGHGIGKVFHEAPQVLHYGQKGHGDKIVRGMCFTIEPMINAGDWRHTMLADGWTAVTIDKKPSAQFEHTLAIIGEGVEVLTAFPDDPVLIRAKELGGLVTSPLAS